MCSDGKISLYVLVNRVEKMNVTKAELVSVLAISDEQAAKLASLGMPHSAKLLALVNIAKAKPDAMQDQRKQALALLGPAPAARVQPPAPATRPSYWLDIGGTVTGPLEEVDARIDGAKPGALLMRVGTENWLNYSQVFGSSSPAKKVAKKVTPVWESEAYAEDLPPDVPSKQRPPIWPYSIGKTASGVFLQAGTSRGNTLRKATIESWRALLTSEVNIRAFLGKLDRMEAEISAKFDEVNG